MIAMNFADLHIHSTFSDGTLSPTEIIKVAKDNGVRCIAITDHDCLDSQYIINMSSEELKIISGIEISSEIDGLEIHILGYFIDYKNQQLINLVNKLAEERKNRIHKIIDKLNENNILIDINDLDIEFSKSISRSHVANAMVKKGYFENYKSAFINYLVKDKPAYVKGYKIHYREVIKTISDAGGVAVLAHPGQIHKGLAVEAFIKELKYCGLRGIEVYHPSHSREEINKFYNLAKKHKLLITGGSDYHGKGCYNENYIGSYGLKEDVFNKLFRRINEIKGGRL